MHRLSSLILRATALVFAFCGAGCNPFLGPDEPIEGVLHPAPEGLRFALSSEADGTKPRLTIVSTRSYPDAAYPHAVVKLESRSGEIIATIAGVRTMNDERDVATTCANLPIWWKSISLRDGVTTFRFRTDGREASFRVEIAANVARIDPADIDTSAFIVPDTTAFDLRTEYASKIRCMPI